MNLLLFLVAKLYLLPGSAGAVADTVFRNSMYEVKTFDKSIEVTDLKKNRKHLVKVAGQVEGIEICPNCSLFAYIVKDGPRLVGDYDASYFLNLNSRKSSPFHYFYDGVRLWTADGEFITLNSGEGGGLLVMPTKSMSKFLKLSRNELRPYFRGEKKSSGFLYLEGHLLGVISKVGLNGNVMTYSNSAGEQISYGAFDMVTKKNFLIGSCVGMSKSTEVCPGSANSAEFIWDRFEKMKKDGGLKEIPLRRKE